MTIKEIEQMLENAIKTSKSIKAGIKRGTQTKLVLMTSLLIISEDVKNICREVLKTREKK